RQTVTGMTLSVTARTWAWISFNSSTETGRSGLTAAGGGSGTALETGSAAPASPAASAAPRKANRRKRMADGHSWLGEYESARRDYLSVMTFGGGEFNPPAGVGSRCGPPGGGF